MTDADVYLARVNRLLDAAFEAGTPPRSGAQRRLDLLSEIRQLTPPDSAHREYERLVSALSKNLEADAGAAEKIQRNVAIAAAADALLAAVTGTPNSKDATRIREVIQRSEQAAKTRRAVRADEHEHLVRILPRMNPPHGMADLHRELINVATIMHSSLRQLMAAADDRDADETHAALVDYAGAITRLHDLWDRMEGRAHQYPP